MEKKVAIIITTYNQDLVLKNCLYSLKRKTDYQKYKVFLVDDGSKKSVGEKMKKEFNWITLITNDENLGFAKSNNLGMKKALKKFNPDYILLLNDDTEIIQKNWLKKMIKTGEQDKNIGIIGCQIVYPDGSLQWVAKKNKIYSFEKPGYKSSSKEFLKIQEIKDNHIIGACFLIKRQVIDKIGFLDEKFSPFYGEETDYCFRAKKKGFKLIYVGESRLVHYGGASTKKLKNYWIWYIKKRNSIRLEWLNFNFFKIIKYSFIHFGSVFKIEDLENLPKKFFLLTKAYAHNLKNIKEIMFKRKERRN